MQVYAHKHMYIIYTHIDNARTYTYILKHACAHMDTQMHTCMCITT